MHASDLSESAWRKWEEKVKKKYKRNTMNAVMRVICVKQAN